MTSNEILKADVLDILFENRNKQYGAYALRKNYRRRLAIALAISFSTALLTFILIPKKNPDRIFTVEDQNDILIRTIDATPPKKIIPPPQAKVQVPQARQKTFVTPIIVQHNPIIPPPDTRELITSAISDRTLDGPADIGIATVEKLNATQASTQTEPAKEVKPDQKEPEFPGGQEAWLNFLRKNLVAPEGLEPGEKKTVAIRFLVATNGTVTGFEVLQSAGRSFDNEVIRVLKKMPRWKPAILNGQPLERAFTQPVTFVGVEE